MKAIQMDKALFLEKVLGYRSGGNEWKYLGDKPCIIVFYADWCGPCKMVAPILQEIAGEYEGKLSPPPPRRGGGNYDLTFYILKMRSLLAIKKILCTFAGTFHYSLTDKCAHEKNTDIAVCIVCLFCV